MSVPAAEPGVVGRLLEAKIPKSATSTGRKPKELRDAFHAMSPVYAFLGLDTCISKAHRIVFYMGVIVDIVGKGNEAAYALLADLSDKDKKVLLDAKVVLDRLLVEKEDAPQGESFYDRVYANIKQMSRAKPPVSPI